MEIPKIRLNTGARMPVIGFGTWQLDDGKEAKSATAEALKIGYRLIDTAAIYGNEESVGEAIRKSGIKREEIFVTTKLWNSEQGYDSALRAFDDSLQRLGLEYTDLYLIHWPGHSSRKRLDSWRALQKLYKEGRARAVGVSNFSVSNLMELIEQPTPLTPAVNQIPFHPFIYGEQKKILEFCEKNKIVVEAYSPLSRGALLSHTTITEIARKLGKTNAQVMLRWAMQHDTVPIPKSAHRERIKENIDVFDFELSTEQMQTLDNLS